MPNASAMSSYKIPLFRNLLQARGSSSILRVQQRRWAQVHDVRFLATHRDPNRVLEKYRAKLDEKAKQEGHSSIESLKEAYKEKISEYRRSASTVITPESSRSPSSSSTISTSPSPPPPPSPQSAQPPHNPSASAAAAAAISQHTKTGIKPLSSYLDLEKVASLPPKEIETLWRLRHANNPRSICAVIPLDTYQRMATAARSHPQFILPLPRQIKPAPSDTETNTQTDIEGTQSETETETAAEIHFLQWGFHPPAADTTPSSSSSSTSATTASSSGNTANNHTSTIVFTHLLAYKTHGSYAQPHTTITHHLDLADSTGLVLMQGQVMPDRGVSVEEASWLVSCVQRFYDFTSGPGQGAEQSRKGELLRMFTSGDVEGFKVEDLVEETEKFS